jgi:tyrosyl-tRNA synthetase
MGFVDELKWRGMLHDIMPGTDALLNTEQVKGYIGFDPTGDSLHVGHLVQVMNLRHLQRAGHRPYALIGGATGMVGDPTGKSTERNLLDSDTLNHNLGGIRKQFEKLLDFDGPHGAVIVNNYDWYKDYHFLDFIRDVGKHITINYMLSKDSVQKRLETGMSFTEFCYQLVQGYDFYYLWQHHGIKLQMGGSDQWGNIVTGTELIRRMAGGEGYALTTKLITKADGSKFSKSEGGNIWLDPAQTSPYKFYQFWLNTADADAKNYIRIMTLKGREEIEALEVKHDAEPHLRHLQRALAADITTTVHSADELQRALAASEILFGNATAEALASLSEQDILDVFEGVPTYELSRDAIAAGVGMIELLAEHTAVMPSKGEAKRSLAENAISINKQKVSTDTVINSAHLLQGKYILAQKGKKNYYLLIAR